MIGRLLVLACRRRKQRQMAALAAFCSDAAAQIRDVAVPIDGGWTAQ